MAIVCLSFYYGVDLETIAVNESLTEVKEKLKEFISNPEELKKISRVLDMNNLNYLDDVLFLEKEKVLKKYLEEICLLFMPKNYGALLQLRQL